MKYILIFFIFIQLPFALDAQIKDSSDVVTILTTDNQYYTGLLTNITSDSIHIIDTEKGKLAFNKKQIKTFIEGTIPTFEQSTTNSSVPYYVQTAIPNGKGNNYYKNYYIFGNEFNFGASKYLNLSFGFETFSLLFENSDAFPVLQLGLKLAIPVTDILHIGMSTKYYFNNFGSALLMSTPITLGNDRTSFTISPNYVISDGDENLNVFANISIGLSPKIRLVIDLINIGETRLTPVVFEYQFNNGFSLSLGALFTSDGTIPNMAFSIPFGNWKNYNRKNKINP